jgi:hypothetical protein
MTYLEQALKLVILQYSDKPNARAEMTNLLAEYQQLWDFFGEFVPNFDIDQAWGDRLDLIGKIVGLSRTISLLIDKKYFGFDHQPNARGFGQAPFYRYYDELFTSTDLNDTDYQFYLKAKIIKNSVRARMGGSNSLQLGFLNLFNNQGYAVDNKDMTITIHLQDASFVDRIDIMRQLNLLPLPQGVGLKEVITP